MKGTSYDVALVAAVVAARDALRGLLPVVNAALDQPQQSAHALREAQRVISSTANALLYTVKGKRQSSVRRQDAAQTLWGVRRPQ